MKKLADFYKNHTGKVSDKWTLYLREYERLLSPYREQAISLLEIGIQNGGSLEIWSQYFPNAMKFVGCDINPDCAKLIYEDPRIVVIVGDATTPETQAKVLRESGCFDLIIEDGSHTSSDIVKAFARYFPALKNGGIFIAEDLHCSYWKDYEGGIFQPYSSIAFFKYLADIVNHEHWGVERSRAQLIDGFRNAINIEFEESLLAQISSVEFINSICVVRKADITFNKLGGRVIAGKKELVVVGHLPIAGLEMTAPIQLENPWSSLPKHPAEVYEELTNHVCQLRDAISDCEELAKKSSQKIFEQEEKVEALQDEIKSLKTSRSWRLTKPLRALSDLILRKE